MLMTHKIFGFLLLDLLSLLLKIQDTLGRGIKIILFLKEDSVEFSEVDTVKKNIKKYSEFIDYPIYMKINKIYTEEEEIDEPDNETLTNVTK